MYVTWTTCQGEEWQGLDASALNDPELEDVQGVYVIWHSGDIPGVVCIGQGNIKDKVGAELAAPEIQAFAVAGLFVAWTEVPLWARNGVEAYLVRHLWPKVERDLPKARPIEVNLPW